MSDKTPQRAIVRARIAGVVDDVYSFVTTFDHRSKWFGCGRSLIAFGSLTVVLFTSMTALTVPVGASPGTRCDGIRGGTLLCLGDPAEFVEFRRWLLVAIYLSVVLGYRPRWTAIPHVWAAYTLSASITLPDGGEAIGLIIALLILPLALSDNRRWHWQMPQRSLSSVWRPISAAASIALRLQVAYIYLDSGLSKLGVDDWKNGTAEFYILRDASFGTSGPLKPIFYWLSSGTWGATALTWGGIAIEVAIGLCLISSRRWRVVGWGLDVIFHISIIATIGLVSFGTVMIGTATVAANPSDRRRDLIPDLKAGTDKHLVPPRERATAASGGTST